MPSPRNLTRQRLIHAALTLFSTQGVTETTTKQIAELAGVNEVTLFRNFGNKHGLLLAVIEEEAVFTQLGQALIQQANQTSNIHQALKDYAIACLQAFERVPDVVRSVVGEAGQFPAKNREALGRGFTQANYYVAEYFQTVLDYGKLQSHLPANQLASLLNGMLLGYAVIELTSEFHDLWQDRDDFLENLVTLFLHGAISFPSKAQNATPSDQMSSTAPESLQLVVDLPAEMVHQILRRGKKIGAQEYALIYVLFGAGLTPSEIVQLQRSHYIHDTHHQVLKILTGRDRQVPINQWILGKRYGSYTNNPLTQWLKTRKDNQTTLFVNADGGPLSEAELRQKWQIWTTGFTQPNAQPLAIEQAQQTWCVEMLGRGITAGELSILTGLDCNQLQPYTKRAREKIVLEQAMRLDRKLQ